MVSLLGSPLRTKQLQERLALQTNRFQLPLSHTLHSQSFQRITEDWEWKGPLRYARPFPCSEQGELQQVTGDDLQSNLDISKDRDPIISIGKLFQNFSQKEKVFLSSNGISICVHCLLPFHWTFLKRIWLSSFPQLFIHIVKIQSKPSLLQAEEFQAESLSTYFLKSVSKPLLIFVALHCTYSSMSMPFLYFVQKCGLSMPEEKDHLP